MKPAVESISLILSGLMAGALFGIWLGYNPKSLSAETYVEQLQSTIKAMNTLMPILGSLTIMLTIFSAFMQKQNTTTFTILLVAAAFLIISGLITKLGNQLINSMVMTWSKNDIPDNWQELRNRWWSLHTTRTLTTVIAFCLIAYVSVIKNIKS